LALRFWRSASGFWRGPSAWRARLITALLIAIVLIQLAIQFRLNYWSRDFFDAFGRRDSATLRQQALLFLPLAGSSMAMAGLAVWSRMTVQRLWRAWLTRHLIDHWLANADFRHLQFTLGEDQNPEYRIAEDARVATEAPVAAIVGLLTSALSAVIFHRHPVDCRWGSRDRHFRYDLDRAQIPGDLSHDLFCASDVRHCGHRAAPD
jgi:putative ATP-binding cassette transporter